MINLIIPPISDCFMPTLGVAQIAGYLKSNNVDCRVFDASAELLSILVEKGRSCSEKIKGLSGNADSVYKNTVAHLNFFSIVNGETEISTDNFRTAFRWQELDKLQEYVENENFFCAELGKLSFLNDKKNEETEYFGLSISYECQVIPAMLLAKVIKEKKPNARISFGGALLYNYENDFYKLMYASELIDILIVGAGEEVLKYIGENEFKKLYCLPGIKIKKIGDKYIIDARELKYKPIVYDPDFSNIDFRYYLSEEKAFPYMIKDKCYYGKCRFCNGDLVEKKSVKKDIKIAFENMQRIARDTGTNNVYIVDAALSPKDFREITETVMEKPLRWIANARFEKGLKEETLISALSRKGCMMLRFGLESASQKVLNLMNKGTNIADVEDILRLNARYGIKNHVYIMFGYPGETAADRKMTIDFLARNREVISSYSVSMFQPIPGTVVYEQLLDKIGYVEEPYEHMKQLIYKDEDYYAEIKRDIFRLNDALRGYAKTNLEYYSANIFNELPSRKRELSLKDMIITKAEMESIFGKNPFFKNQAWIYERQSEEKTVEKYVLIDLYKNLILHLLIASDTVDEIKKYFEGSIDAENVEKGKLEEFETIVNRYVYSVGIYSSVNEKLKYFVVTMKERDLNREVSLQFRCL